MSGDTPRVNPAAKAGLTKIFSELGIDDAEPETPEAPTEPSTPSRSADTPHRSARSPDLAEGAAPKQARQAAQGSQRRARSRDQPTDAATRPSSGNAAQPASRGRVPGTAKRQLKITLPAWLDDAVRELWETQAITFSELIDDILGDEPHQLTPDEARQWRRSQRLAHRARKRQLGAATGTPHRTLLVAPDHLARLDKAAAASGVARSTLLAVLLARHPTVAEAADEPGPPDNPTEAGVDSS